jgi:hypothetical protein
VKNAILILNRVPGNLVSEGYITPHSIWQPQETGMMISLVLICLEAALSSDL